MEPLLNDASPVVKRQRLITIEPVQFLYALYAVGAVPLMSQFVRSQVERHYNSSTTNVSCGDVYNSDADRIEAEASRWLLYMRIAGMIPAFIATVLISGYSDSVGRKVALIPPLIGAAACLLVYIAIVSFNLPPSFLILASLCEGLGGGFCTWLMAAFSYISSVTSIRSRSVRVVIVELTSGLAMVVTYLTVGYTIDLLGYAWTCVILLSCIFLALCYVVFVLPEPGPAAGGGAKTGLFAVKHFARVLSLYVRDDAEGSARHWKLRFTLLAMAMTSTVQLGSSDVQTLFMISAPFCFTSVWVGYFYAVTALVQYGTSVFVTHFLVNHTGDLVLVLVGLLFGVGYQLMFGLATTKVMLFFASVVGCASRLPIALVRAYNSKIVKADEIGLMFASLAWVEIAGTLLGSVAQNAVLSATVRWMESFVFLLNAAFYLLIALLTVSFIAWLRCKNLSVIPRQTLSVDPQTTSVNANSSDLAE